MERIKARHLATGDTVYFPRLGAQVIKQIYTIDSMGVTFLFEDRQTRRFKLNEELDAEISDYIVPPNVPNGYIYRLATENGRISILTRSALYGMGDINGDCLEPFPRVGIGPTRVQAVVMALEHGGRLYTERAIYWMELSTTTTTTAATAAVTTATTAAATVAVI